MKLTIEDTVMPTDVRGDKLVQGHIYRDDCDDLVMATDEGSVLNLASGVLEATGCTMFTPVKARLKVEA